MVKVPVGSLRDQQWLPRRVDARGSAGNFGRRQWDRREGPFLISDRRVSWPNPILIGGGVSPEPVCLRENASGSEGARN